jgi:hypothetical protein
MEERSGVLFIMEQRNSVLMYYTELQSRSAEVGAMAMNFLSRGWMMPSQRLDEPP